MSPILFHSFNTDLLQHRIEWSGGAITFVDSYTAWVVGKTAAENKRSSPGDRTTSSGVGRRDGPLSKG
jgi:hypothetical protein